MGEVPEFSFHFSNATAEIRSGQGSLIRCRAGNSLLAISKPVTAPASPPSKVNERIARSSTMTTSHGQPPEFSTRLDRIEAIVAANSEQIVANASAIGRLALAVAANTAAITRLEANQAASSERVDIMAERVNTVSESVNQVSHIALATLRRIDAMQVEIRGLQTENRRILELLEQRGQGGGDSA
ncbi:hypothetical protein [Gloeobacter violaceus]|uniref:Gll2634 protein n=1 Tax=Gloeobacter violaceus (strain ATCC 29082 / PCC 7421) TaxID=251221 RepID=Q7NHA3_GLOVI|nr:hypothetical protein [Gloeobacter violaceus]BAC90575.1 gll2634 [Gloeobacter violaceus PCC 7421]